MKKARLLRMSEMTPIQQLVYEMLPVGQDDYNNVSRTEAAHRLHKSDSNARKIVKSLLPFVPVVATKGYFIAETPEEIDAYVAKLESKIKGLQRTVTYLKKHKTQMLKDTEF